MQLSSFTDYSIRVLIYLSTLAEDELTSITAVSQYYKISKNHLVKVVYKLGKLGYVETKQGKRGGIKLKIHSKHINIGKVIRQVEPLELFNCSVSSCYISPACRLKKYLLDAKEAFLKELDQYTIDDLVRDNQKLINLL
ncbi:nitric oxide-sensing transcriptional repressor NsrR [Gilliamella mensalis]|uniref:nitric oxide-sensing transcriptional repressor NsrR n=1 Tax=Gilliamella mensalis TaxID=1908520 RepID=UPI000A14D833|nr:nitric oxide-sensing transcriptional repressor NsrR [Gilliamella mensalis]